ncbi:pentapeptide repeat-containing protein [Altericista sp. CCNU0014]|uniref:pentapeptide repeat-containing protein n=1 Tax=Altericista sp. CCNU0014 TaxID=3082949 RepID=UPI00384EA7F3
MPDPSDSNPSEFAPLEKSAVSMPDSQVGSAHSPVLPPAAAVGLSLGDDLKEVRLFEEAELDRALLDRIRQGDTAALHQVLNSKLAVHQAEVVESSLRGDRLQLSVSGPEVPDRNILEPLLQRWIAQLELANIARVELYGQRNSSDLPFWRSTFNPLEVDLNHYIEEISQTDFSTPSAFVDPLQVEFETAPSPRALEEPTSLQTEPLMGEEAIPDPFLDPALATSIPEAPEIDYWTAVPQPEDAAGTGGEAAAASQPSTLIAMASAGKIKAVADFLARYAAGERTFPNTNLSEANLSGVNLTLADLHNSEFIWTNFKDASLYHVNLSGAKLRHADLSGAKLRSSNLQGTDFLNANLSGADLSWSNLNGANLTGADLTDANLSNAILERVILPDGTLLD